MRTIDDAAIARSAARRFLGDFEYAVFEYQRSAKLIDVLEKAGVRLTGRVLDAGCGGGGTTASLAEETRFTVGLDLDARFRDAGLRLVGEKTIRNAAFVQGDGEALPFRDASFDLVCSHSVIEHVTSAEAYLRECRRVLRDAGVLYLSTAPHRSFAGAHLPRLRVPLPLHLLLPRPLAFRIFRELGRHAPWALREPREANSFVALAARGLEKTDDLRQRITLARLETWIQDAGFRVLRRELHVTGFFRRAVPPALRRRLARSPFARDVMIGHVQYVLEKA